MTYLKAVEAGADVIDTAISPFSGGTAQPATETLAYALRQLGYQVDLDDKVLVKMADFFKGVRADFLADGTLDPISMATDTQCLNYQDVYKRQPLGHLIQKFRDGDAHRAARHAGRVLAVDAPLGLVHGLLQGVALGLSLIHILDPAQGRDIFDSDLAGEVTL